MAIRRMIPFLLLNIVVSAAVVLGILYWWEGRQADEAAVAAARPNLAELVPPTSTPLPQSLLVTHTPEPSPTIEQTIYTVQAGDTLGNISDTFEVLLDDLMNANGLSNADFLQVGQELIIPIGGFVEATETPIPTETPLAVPTPIATVTPSQGAVVLEIREVIGVGELVDEAISLVNVGSRQVGLQGWTLVDEDGFVYTFDQVTLFGDGAGILIHTEAGISTALDLYWGLEEPILRPGELIRLIDAEGTEQATYLIPGDPDEGADN